MALDRTTWTASRGDPTLVEHVPDARVVGIGRRNLRALQEPSGIVEREARAFDVRRVVGFEQEGSRAHRRDPLLRQGGGFQEAARSFDPGER